MQIKYIIDFTNFLKFVMLGQRTPEDEVPDRPTPVTATVPAGIDKEEVTVALAPPENTPAASTACGGAR